jgi:putative flippase GtrA
MTDDSRRAVALRRHPTVQRLGRFALSGIVVQVVYAALMAVLLLALGLPRQGALALSYVGALAVHFSLNRQFVFASSDGYAHGLSSHGKRYLLTAVGVYGFTALGLAVVPEALGVAPYVGWLLVTGMTTVLNFLFLGRFVFR